MEKSSEQMHIPYTATYLIGLLSISFYLNVPKHNKITKQTHCTSLRQTDQIFCRTREEIVLNIQVICKSR